MDRLDLVRARCQQIPDAGTHMVRYYGAYANCTRRRLAEARAVLAHGGQPAPEGPPEPQELLPREVELMPRDGDLRRGVELLPRELQIRLALIRY